MSTVVHHQSLPPTSFSCPGITCGARHGEATKVTRDRVAVTCKRCARSLRADTLSPEMQQYGRWGTHER